MGATSDTGSSSSTCFVYKRSLLSPHKPRSYAFRNGSCMARQELPSSSGLYSQCAPSVETVSLSLFHEDMDTQFRSLHLGVVGTQFISGAVNDDDAIPSISAGKSVDTLVPRIR